LNSDFIKAIKTLFKNKKIAITVSVEEDEMEYLLSTDTNKRRLLQSVENVKKGINMVPVDINKLMHEARNV
jgi:hypothetical protein